ncbi:MAG TPA: MBL fold metallo-hydrolase [Trebonia sp.]|jgi:L-ascorbate metabolism protein UlaG (beta-lactamase superfamily)|nr:MBL fold metallo-hydrolase [Trebonia sp.]
MTSDERGRLGVRYLGGPTALLELGGLRLLTDPTFDPAGDYPIGNRELRKTIGAVVSPQDVGRVDAVLLSHDQHPDNLDRQGRDYLASAPLVLSTAAAQERLGGTVRALENWQHLELPRSDGAPLRVTGVPARHGPPGCEPKTGPVTGFMLTGDGLLSVYVSGDNAAPEHAAAVAEHFGPVDVAILFAGAARTPLIDGYLTLTSDQAVEAAAILGARHVVPLHFEGWAHFSQGGDTLDAAFTAAGLRDRLHLLQLGQNVMI